MAYPGASLAMSCSREIFRKSGKSPPCTMGNRFCRSGFLLAFMHLSSQRVVLQVWQHMTKEASTWILEVLPIIKCQSMFSHLAFVHYKARQSNPPSLDAQHKKYGQWRTYSLKGKTKFVMTDLLRGIPSGTPLQGWSPGSKGMVLYWQCKKESYVRYHRQLSKITTAKEKGSGDQTCK